MNTMNTKSEPMGLPMSLCRASLCRAHAPLPLFPAGGTARFVAALAICLLAHPLSAKTHHDEWRVDSTEDWTRTAEEAEGLKYEKGLAIPEGVSVRFLSKVKRFDHKTKASRITFTQSPEWNNWTPTDPVGPENLGDAPVMLVRGPNDYWMFGLYQNRQKHENFQAESVTLAGFDVPLRTTPFNNQFDAPGGLDNYAGGYHAWQSRDMVHWVHHGVVTERFSRWVTTAEYADGKAYIYYDFPNDQNPHLYIDDDLTDGKPGKHVGMVFDDPSDGSDCGVIRDLDGRFHLIYEDWSPIDASRHSWDSPLAGHAVSEDGKGNFEILEPAVDYRTEPTGVMKKYTHPHWHREAPDLYPVDPDLGDGQKASATYEVHEPEQDAYGDWAAIGIGGRYYLFGDFHPANTKGRESMSIGMFTSDSLSEPFRFFGNVGQGHPDPDIGFAEGRFYLLTQTDQDFVSPGPWVGHVEARVGVDVDGDGEIDEWTQWQEVEERYDYIEGFAKQVERIPASIDLGDLPAGYGFAFAFKLNDATENDSRPLLDQVILSFVE